MPALITLDAHAHIDPRRSSTELAEVGVVLAMSLSLDEADQTLRRMEAEIAWGVGCHPRKLAAQQAFDQEKFTTLAERSAIIGEVGLDAVYKVPLKLQLSTFRFVLGFAAQNPRIVSIHSFRTTGLVLEELRRTPIIAPILHWWTGNAAETRQAVELGCHFSVHSAVARRSIFRTQVPPERLLVESDHGWTDPPGAIPHRVAWVEYLLAASLGMEVMEVRQLVWRNFGELVRLTGTLDLLPRGFGELLGRGNINTPKD